jgi:sulfite exporter TauE/SafE
MADQIAALILIPIGVLTAYASRMNTDILDRSRRLPSWLRIPARPGALLIGAWTAFAVIGLLFGWLPR